MQLRSKHCAYLALAFCAVAVYGSFVPFHFTACSWSDAADRLRSVCHFTTRPSRSDFAANVLLFVPIGFFLAGTIGVDRRRLVAWLAALVVLPAALALSVAIEVAQIYFPPRTPSMNDCLAQAIGTAVGVALWLACGQSVVRYVRTLGSRPASGSAARLLPAYLLILLLVHIMPLDLVISPVELYHKFKEGRIILLPFSGVLADGFASKLIWNLSFFAPLGWLYAAEPIVWNRGTGRTLQVLAFAMLVPLAVELAQLPVRSRSFDSTDIVTGAAGVLVGCQLARALGRAATALSRSATDAVRPALVRFALVAVWLVLLAAVHWRPFDFADGLAAAHARTTQINWIPFADYLVDTEYHAFDELHRKFLLFLPLGGLLAIVRASSLATSQRGTSLGCILAAAVAIEAGQILLPARYPSLTDVLVQFLGGWAGVAIASWARSVRDQVPQDTSTLMPAVS
jgi:glycopeptide antibiotics resistance protein